MFRKINGAVYITVAWNEINEKKKKNTMFINWELAVKRVN